MRPLREVPVPQPAAAPIEGGIDAAADRFIDQVRLPRPCRLPMKGETENEHNEPRRSRQCDRERGERAPVGKGGVPRLNYRELAKRGTKHTDGRQSPCVVGQGDFQDAGTSAEGRQGLCRSQQLDEPAANRRVAGRGRGHDDAVRIGQQEAPTGSYSPGWQHTPERQMRLFDGIGSLLGRLVQTLGSKVGDCLK